MNGNLGEQATNNNVLLQEFTFEQNCVHVALYSLAAEIVEVVDGFEGKATREHKRRIAQHCGKSGRQRNGCEGFAILEHVGSGGDAAPSCREVDGGEGIAGYKHAGSGGDVAPRCR